ncbi:MAG: carboxypeptidase regulatory-like domain-containing protein [Planctomycetes bacterium]|nr:carboxypeptidase regulatory-like domain-containing protein [Planctomycetota bacterium]
MRSVVMFLMTAIVAQQPSVGVRVLDAEGAAAPAAAIEVRWRAFPELPGLVGRSLGGDGVATLAATADERGRASIVVPVHGPFEITARAPGSRSVPKFPVLAGDFVDLTLRPAFVVAGTLRDAAGEPIAGAALTAVPNPTSWARMAAYRLPEARGDTVTAADGTFALEWHEGYLQAPVYEPFVSLQLRDGRLLHQENELLRPTKRCQQLELKAGAVAVEQGRILQANGTPAVGAEIFDRQRPWLSTSTDADGAFVFPILASRATVLWVRLDGHVLTPIACGGKGAPANPYPLTLARAPAAMLMLVDHAGAALAGAEVLWVIHDPIGDLRLGEPRIELSARTDERGQVAVPPIAPRLAVQCFARRAGLWHWVGDSAAENVATWRQATMPPTRRITGRVRASDGVPLPAVRVVLRGTAMQWPLEWVTFTDRRGEFVFASAPPGAVTLDAEGSAHGFANATFSATAERCDLAFAAGESVTVILRDSDGQPVAGGWVSLIASSNGQPQLPGFGGASAAVCALTGPDGVAQFRGLPDLHWQVVGNFLRDGSVHSGGGQVGSGQEITLVARRSRA